MEMTHRFFVRPESMVQGRVTFGAALAHQMRSVLRLCPGAIVFVLDDSGWEYEVELTHLQRDWASGRVCTQRLMQTEPHLSLTLYQSVLRGDRFEWVVQKGTELGVSTFVPILGRRTIATDVQRIEKKRPRWERIIREAAEQSRRGRLPCLAKPLSFSSACQRGARNHDLSLIPWEEWTQDSLCGVLCALDPRPKTVALWIGPEGGFDPDEIALARRLGIRAVTLGPRILRAETAGLAAVAIVLSALGEMGG